MSDPYSIVRHSGTVRPYAEVFALARRRVQGLVTIDPERSYPPATNPRPWFQPRSGSRVFPVCTSADTMSARLSSWTRGNSWNVSQLGYGVQGLDYVFRGRAFLRQYRDKGGVMKQLIRLFVSVFLPAFVLAGVAANSAMAQDKAKDAKAAPATKAEKGKATAKVLHDDDKLRVVESSFKPGDEGPNVARPLQVIRVLKGGTIQRTWADGKVDKVEYKTGDVVVRQPLAPFTPKNIGKSDLVLYVVFVKEPKK